MKTAIVGKILTAAGEVILNQMSQEKIEAHLKQYPNHAKYFKSPPPVKTAKAKTKKK